MHLNLLAATTGMCLLYVARAAPVSIASSDISAARSVREEQLFSRGRTGFFEDVVSDTLHSIDEAAHVGQAIAAPESSASFVGSLTASPHASNAATELAMYKESLNAGQGMSSDKTGVSKQQLKRLHYLEQKAAAEARGTTIYYERLKRLTEAGEAESLRRSRDYKHERELRMEKYIRNGGTRESFKDAETRRWRKSYDKRRQKEEAAREAAESVRLQQHLDAGGTRESFKPAKPMQRRQGKRRYDVSNDGEGRFEAKAKSSAQSPEAAPPSTFEAWSSTGPPKKLRDPAAQQTSKDPLLHVIPSSRFPLSFSPVDDVDPPLYSAAHRQDTTAAAADAVPPATHHAPTRQQQAPIAHPQGFVAGVSQEHLPAARPHLQPATPDQPSDINAWVDSLFVDLPE